MQVNTSRCIVVKVTVQMKILRMSNFTTDKTNGKSRQIRRWKNGHTDAIKLIAEKQRNDCDYENERVLLLHFGRWKLCRRAPLPHYHNGTVNRTLGCIFLRAFYLHVISFRAIENDDIQYRICQNGLELK